MNYFLSLVNEAAIFGALAALQVLLLNRLGLAFAAIPVFAGLAAYAVAAWSISPTLPIALLLVAAALAVGMSILSNSLQRDLYLLATLAAIECVGGAVGISTTLGGREGLPLPPTWSVGGPGFETITLLWTVGSLLALTLIIRLTLHLCTGVAIDRLREQPRQCVRWFPVAIFRWFVVGLSVALAGEIGVVYLAYHGRVGPGVFSLDFALLVLAFSVMAGRWPELAAPAAMLYWILPYGMTKLFPLSQQGAADLIRICWGCLLIGAVLVPQLLRERRRMRGGVTR
jgi:ABC-type branched-subunit amino acid transport system permease subunit